MRNVPVKGRMATLLGIQIHPGYTGVFTRKQAKKAMPNETTVIKIAIGEKDDVYPIGTRGVILGSFHFVPFPLYYFVEWEPSPRVAYACKATDIEKERPDEETR